MIRKKIQYVLLALIFCASNYEACGQYQPGIGYRIEYLTSDDGLSQNTVDCILKDSRGFMWFGTWNGLNRYDGYEFKVYKKEKQKNSLSSNFIYSLAEDKQGNIWVGTKNGLNLFDFTKEKFFRFYFDSTYPNTIPDNNINHIYVDKAGSIWVGTQQGGLTRITPNATGDNFSFKHFNVQEGSLSNNNVRRIFIDSKERLWVGTADGLNMRVPGEKKFQVFRNEVNDPRSISYSDIRCVFEDRTGAIWVGTHYGLNRWFEGTSEFQRYSNSDDDPRTISHYVINEITEDPEGNIFVASLGGVDIYNRASDDFDRLPVYQKSNFSLNNEFINSVYCDQSGLVWIGTDKGGVNKLNIYQKKFHHLSADSEDKIQLSHNTINSIFDEEDKLWIGTAGGGLNIVNKQTGEVSYYLHNPHRAQSITTDFITSIIRDSYGDIWIGTWGGGFDKLISEKGSGTFVHFKHSEGDTNTLVRDFVSSVYEDSRKNLWIGTEGGLDLYNRETGNFTHVLTKGLNGPPITEVGCILEDRSNNLWVGTRNGLFYIPDSTIEQLSDHPQHGYYKCFRNIPGDSRSINENYVISLHEDSNGVIWAGTYGSGINKVMFHHNRQDADFVTYNQGDKLSNNIIYGILEDEEGYLWLSTDYGLSKFNPETEVFRNYYQTDGLQSNQFYWSAYHKGIDNHLYFGGTQGLNYFKPSEIRDNQTLPTPLLTEFKLFNNVVEVNTEDQKKPILNKVISCTREINLNYRQNTFSFEFSGLSYDLPEKNKYMYKLVGIDEDWVTVNSDRRFASYTKLPGGEYTFLLKAANSDEKWSSEPLALKVNITPPFWLTTGFRIILFVFILISIFVYLKLHTRSLQLQKRKLERQVSERTAKIEQQKDLLTEQARQLKTQNDQLEHRQEQIEGQKEILEKQNAEILQQRDKLIQLNKKVKAANQLKLKFFTNISHEFRTPLTLILGPLEKLIKNIQDDESRNLLSLIDRNANRLLHLINQLMEFRKIERGKMSLHVRKNNLNYFVEEIVNSFIVLAEERNISLKFVGEKSMADTWFDPVKLENILYNLLSNAFKYTPEGGEITISLNYELSSQKQIEKHKIEVNGSHPKNAVIRVSDTGIGLSEEEQANIFKRFYRAGDNNSRVAGSGIGLALSHELIKIHRGKISLTSKPGHGTTFSLSVPCSRKLFYDEEILSEKNYKINIDNRLKSLRHTLSAYKENGDESATFISSPDKPTIVLAEDNLELQQFVADRLHESYNLLLASNGKQALLQAQKYNPDLIVSDIMMPVMDGLELCKTIKSELATSHIPVVLLTAKGSEENQIEGLKTGADDYVPKPFSMELLEVRISNLIASRRKLRELFNHQPETLPEEFPVSDLDREFLNKSLQLVEENLDNTEFGVNDFAKQMCVSRSLLHKKLRALTDKSATDYINSIRLQKSKVLLSKGIGNISQIAYSVGYNDPKYFSRLFRKYYGKSPSEILKGVSY